MKNIFIYFVLGMFLQSFRFIDAECERFIALANNPQVEKELERIAKQFNHQVQAINSRFQVSCR